ncbi:MAG: bifunctional methylenetetrahydrofolate dehydrogenase/methenyltetrahydrofolate cyclohydrolase [Myxococcota bacterium]
MAHVLDPDEISKSFLETIREEVEDLSGDVKIVGLLANDDRPARVYAKYTARGSERVGIGFELRELPRLELEREILAINEDPSVHGVMVYYPIFGVERDNTLKDLLDPRKDIEGLSTYWLRRLYDNKRTDEDGKKALLPCTPLSIVKLLEAAGAMHTEYERPLAGKTVTVFNRSEVVGRPLASMLANDGATVHSFNEHGPLLIERDGVSESTITRREAIGTSQIVITGVPSRAFALLKADELADHTICLNFSTVRNFTDGAREKAEVFIPRVGPMTVTMVLRNTIRLFRNYHS